MTIETKVFSIRFPRVGWQRQVSVMKRGAAIEEGQVRASLDGDGDHIHQLRGERAWPFLAAEPTRHSAANASSSEIVQSGVSLHLG